MGNLPIGTLERCEIRAVILSTSERDERLTISHDGTLDNQASPYYALQLTREDGYILGSIVISGQLLRNAMGIINSYEQSLFQEVQRG